MKKIKVYLQYPWMFKDSPYYKSLLENPPQGVEYIGSEKKNVIIDKRFFWIFDKSKKAIKILLKVLGLERPNAHLTRYSGKYDLIHCAHCLSKNEDKPWVADIEMYGSLFIGKKRSDKLDRKSMKIIMKKNCKKIMPWSNGVKESIVKWVPKIEEKMEVLYPAIPPQKGKIDKNNKIPKIIFISRYFYTKGGLIALEVMEKLKAKCECIVISSVPPYLKKKYPHIKFYELLPQQKLFSLMEETDIMLYPTTSDTFGFSLLESMSFGIPSVSLRTPWTQSIKEIVEDGKTGFLVETKEIVSQKSIGSLEKDLINKLTEKILKLIEDKGLRKKMSENCIKEITQGKFSIKKRNEKLRKIYEEALK